MRISRTVWVEDVITRVWVCTWPPSNFTPSRRRHSVTPVAANTASPVTSSSKIVLAAEIGVLQTEAAGAGLLVLVAEHEPPLELAADALQRRRRQNALRRAALADVEIDAGLRIGGVDHPRDVAVGDQIARARRPSGRWR